MRFSLISFGLIVSLVLISNTWAHHSHGNYQMTEYTYLEGVVQEMYWINPHAWIYLEVVDSGNNSTVWALETAGASRLSNIGLSRDTIKEGDTISVRCHQLRDGSNGCLLGFLTPEGGEEKLWD
jgi:hypothetical protein